MPRLERQVLLFIAVGLSQLAIEALLYVACTLLGVTPLIANLVARVLAAAGGYFMHSRVTFLQAKDTRRSSGTWWRYGSVWIALTAASTLAVTSAVETVGLHGSWIAKPMVDGVLAVVSFLLLKAWVFRSRPW